MRMSCQRCFVGIVAVLLASAVVLFGQAQDLSPRVGALLERLPADTPAIRAELLKLEPTDIQALCGKVVEPGTGDDAKVRFALHGLALAVGDPDQTAARDSFVGALVKVLGGSPRPRDPVFIIEQLQLAGNDRAVPVLAGLLNDESLCGPAAAALLEVDRTAAAPALRAALADARGKCRVTIIDALGALADAECVPALLKDATSDDGTLREAALCALARSGAAEAADTLMKASRVDSPQERACTTDCLLAYAAQRAATTDGRAAMAAIAIYRELLRTRTSPDEAHVRCAALYGLASGLGQLGLADVLKALGDESPQVRAAAANAAVAVSGKEATLACVAAFEKSTGDARAALLTVLARRGDAAGLPTALAALKDEARDVRLAAINAAAVLGGGQALAPLLGSLTTEQAEETAAVRVALIGIPGTSVTEALGKLLATATPGARVVLLEALAARPPVGDIAPLVAAAQTPEPEVRLAALRALEVLAAEGDLPALLKLLMQAEGDEQQAAAEKSIAATARRATEREKPAALIVAALDGQPAEVRGALLGALGRVGGSTALAALRAALADPQPEIQTAAARAFGEWPDAGPAAQVLEFARQTSDLKQNVLALRAYVRMIGLVNDRTAAETLKLCASALEVARRPDEKKLVFARVGDVADPRSVALLDPYLADPALGSEAASATLTIVEAFLPGRWRDARAPLDKVLAGQFPPALRERAERALKRLEENEGFITEWWVAGPYTQTDKPGNELFDVEFPPEQVGRKDVAWHRQPAAADANRAWLIDLHVTMPGDNRAGYLLTRVFSPQEQAARLELGSDDGIKAWINGALVDANNALRGLSPGNDKVNVTLKKGWNTLLLKVTNNDGAWAACARIRTPDGANPPGVYAEAGAKP